MMTVVIKGSRTSVTPMGVLRLRDVGVAISRILCIWGPFYFHLNINISQQIGGKY